MSNTSQRPKIQVSKTKSIPYPNEYIKALAGEFADWAFDEEKGPHFRGLWRSKVFKVAEEQPLDLEIGTGNGFHFAHYAGKHPERNLVGIELKYKPLVQSIRRAVRDGCQNARAIRYNARILDDLFAENELNDVIVHFPDPYLKKRFRKRRLLTTEFLVRLHRIQRPGSRLFFKTDSEDYFNWAMEQVEASPYQVEIRTRDLHKSEWNDSNFRTAFENIFTRQGLPIYMSVWKTS